MSVISVNSGSGRGKRAPIIEGDDEFQGLWLNVGIMQGDPAIEGEDSPEPTFVRLPRGVALSDLKPRKLYANMDPEFAASAGLMNQLIAELQKRALTLAEGESIPVNLSVQLYRRQEEAVQVDTPAENADLATALFT